jgi:hypothetical protein
MVCRKGNPDSCFLIHSCRLVGTNKNENKGLGYVYFQEKSCALHFTVSYAFHLVMVITHQLLPWLASDWVRQITLRRYHPSLCRCIWDLHNLRQAIFTDPSLFRFLGPDQGPDLVATNTPHFLRSLCYKLYSLRSRHCFKYQRPFLTSTIRQLYIIKLTITAENLGRVSSFFHDVPPLLKD